MKNSSKSSPSMTSPEERSTRIKHLQAWLLSDIYPSGMNRSSAAVELMRLRNTRTPKKKKEEDQ